MPMIGDPSKFAVQYELDEKHGGEWLFGKICFRIGGQIVGEYALGTSLRDFLLQIEQGRRDHGRRRNKRFESMPAREIIRLLEAALFEGGGDIVDRRAIEEQWARQNITPEVDVFDEWRVFLVESDSHARVLYRRSEANAEVHEVLLSPGEVDAILGRACVELGALYEATKREPGT